MCNLTSLILIMSSSQVSLQYLTNIIIYICPIVLLFVGTFGCLGNLITFTSKKLNKNSCVSYLLSTSFFELLTITFGLISRIADQYGSPLQKQSRIYCKIRYYFALTFPTIVTFLLLMAAIDRCMSTSKSFKYRSICQMKVAYRLIPIVIVFCMIACSHTLIFVDNQPSCFVQPGIYSLFYSIFLTVFCNLLPNSLLLIVSLWTIRNKRQAQNRIVQITALTRQQRANTQFIRVKFFLLIHILFHLYIYIYIYCRLLFHKQYFRI